MMAHYKTSESITGKIILKATVTNLSNLLIGTGEGDLYDFQVILDENEKIFIPASGFAGMMRKHFYKRLEMEDGSIRKHAEYLWGSDDARQENTSQSHIIIEDLPCEKTAAISVRDGVEIDVNGISSHNSKYDYELVEPGAEFSLSCEINIRSTFNASIFLQFVKFIATEGKNQKYKQGAFTSHGFGQLGLSEIKVYHLDFPNNNDDAKIWFDYLATGAITKPPVNLNEIANLALKKESESITITGAFKIKNSLIIGASDVGSLSDNLDKTHIKNSKGYPLLTAKSLRGSIRHRALKIMKTIENLEAETIVNSLFGYVNKNKKKLKKKGRIDFNEYVFDDLTKVDSEQIQPRIKIDRFTGGTMNTALLSSQPLWHKDEAIHLNFEINDYDVHEIALMLLVMKDLMNEDLPIGGEKAIGRGVLTGKKLLVKKDESNYFEIEVADDHSLTIKSEGEFELDKIEKWVADLHKFNGHV